MKPDKVMIDGVEYVPRKPETAGPENAVYGPRVGHFEAHKYHATAGAIGDQDGYVIHLDNMRRVFLSTADFEALFYEVK